MEEEIEDEPEPRRASCSKKKFTEEEDSLILEMVGSSEAPDWIAISQRLGTRTPRQCRERWRHYLKPVIKRSEWTDLEDRILEQEHENLGPRWSLLAAFLPGRTEVNIKNRWSKICRKRHTRRYSQLRPRERPPPPKPSFQIEESVNLNDAKKRPLKIPSIFELCSGNFPAFLPIPTDSHPTYAIPMIAEYK
jgi:hypothetical protein